MQVDAANCPKCGAPLEMSGGRAEERCHYCGTLVHAHRRTAPFRVAAPVAAPVPTSSGGGGRAMLVLAALALVASGAGVLFLSRHSLRGTAAIGLSEFDDPPMLADANGDGVPDVIGHVKTFGADSLAALDGATGTVLWKVAMPEASFKGLHAIVGDLFITVDELGKVQATRISNGSPAWAGLLTDKASSFCKDQGSAIIGAADGTFTRFDLATGKKTAVDLGGRKRPSCASVYSTKTLAATSPSYETLGWPDFESHGLPFLTGIPGMMAHRAIVPTTGPGIAFMLGSRDKGTQVAMVAAVEKGKVLWKDLVPGVDPLTTTVNVTTILAASDGARVAIPYAIKGSKGMRMACFDARSGKRLWDTRVHDGAQVEEGIAMEAGRVYYSSWTSLYVLSAQDGKLVYQVGHDL